jgi:hypothetical protein
MTKLKLPAIVIEAPRGGACAQARRYTTLYKERRKEGKKERKKEGISWSRFQILKKTQGTQ